MKSIVTIIDNTPVTTSLVVAEGVGHNHKSVIQLVREHREDLEQFGNLAFQMRNTESAGRPTEYAVLNEQQTTRQDTLRVPVDFLVRSDPTETGDSPHKLKARLVAVIRRNVNSEN